VAKIARALIWERALATAREQAESLDPMWSDATLETLRSVRDSSYLIGV
jgi:ABC-type phosphate/phosphonate transport system ATPase subunit